MAAWDTYVALVKHKIRLQQQDTLVRAASKTETPLGPDPSPSPSPDPALHGFPRAVFGRIRTPGFKYVAPELVFPDAALLSRLSKRRNKRFEAENGTAVMASILFPLHDNINAGLCASNHQAWQDGVGLILPKTNDDFYTTWAADSPGENNEPPLFEDVWMSKWGCHWRGGPYWRYHPPRLASVIRKWTELVENGVWKVGCNGIVGKLDEFKKDVMSINDPDP